MDLRSRVSQILNDVRLHHDPGNEESLVADYGDDHTPGAIYRLADQYGWQPLYELLVEVLRDDASSQSWELAQTVLFYAASDHRSRVRHCPMPADFTIALLYHRFPDGIDDGDRIWAVVCALKGVQHWSDYDPMNDPAILGELAALGM